MPDLDRALLDAGDGPAILRAAARLMWHMERGGECPDDAIPSEADLCAWHEECPPADVAAAAERLAALYPDLRAPVWAIVGRAITGSEVPALAAHWRGDRGALEFARLVAVHARWRAGEPGAGRPHPITPLVAAWQRRPVPVRANVQTARPRIIPAQIAMFDAPEDDARGRLFSAPRPRGEPAQLPMFEAGVVGGEYIAPALPLALYELGIGRGTSGTGASPALRLWVESILAAPLRARHVWGDIGRPLALGEWTVRYMLGRLYPGRRPKPKEWRPVIDEIQRLLASRDAAIRWDDGVLRSAVLITSFPEHLDDPIRILVDLPPGAVYGPQVSDRLHLYGPKRGRHYRALLNLAYWWHEPGRTLIPAGRGGHWLRASDPKRYRELSDAELVHLVFPTSTRAARRKLVHEAHRVIADLAGDGELRIVGRKVLPPLDDGGPEGEGR